MASNPNAEKGESNSAVFMKGMGIDLIKTLVSSFAVDKDLKEFSKHALFMSSIIPEELIGNKKE